MPALAYDSSFFSIIPDAIHDDPRHRALLHQAGLRANAPGMRIALFRDPATVEALRAAPKPVQDWLMKSGFGLNVSPCRIPPGLYRASDEADRLRVMQRLQATVQDFDLSQHGSPEAQAMAFSITDLVRNLNTAEPVADDWMDAQMAKVAPPPAPKRAAQKGRPGCLRLVPVVALIGVSLTIIAATQALTQAVVNGLP